MRDPTASTSCLQGAPPISLREPDVLQRYGCAAGAHIVFIGTTGLGSMVMRGQLTASVLNQSFARHGAQSSYIGITAPNNDTKQWAMVQTHFDNIGGPSACVIIKYSVAWVGAACRRRGALVLVDSIDNHRAYSKPTLHNEHYSAMDAIIVQTEAHAAMLASWQRLAVVLPHPHGNLGAWGIADSVRPQIRGVGFVVQDAKNMPTRADMNTIVAACCRANVTLYLVSSRADGMVIKPVLDANCSSVYPPPTADMVGSCRTDGGESDHKPVVKKARVLKLAGWWSLGNISSIRDTTLQRRYYDSPRLLEAIDVGLVWRPGHQQGGRIAVDNRPPTRMHWWWSHGIPVVGYPMMAYLDAARRAGYPEELLNLTTTEQIEMALRRLAPASERSCLQRLSWRGAHLSSPWYASLELLAAVCAAAERCGQPLRRGAQRSAGRSATRVGSTAEPLGVDLSIFDFPRGV
jgi:hypothetical protein